MRVLEVGCSNGRWLKWFKKEYEAETYGVDTNDTGKERVDNFYCANGLKLPFDDETFDVVYSMGLIEHLKTSRLQFKLISEHARVVKKKTGIVWIQHPNLYISLDWFYVKYFYDYKQGYRHYNIYSRETKKHFQNINLDIISTKWLG